MSRKMPRRVVLKAPKGKPDLGPVVVPSAIVDTVIKFLAERPAQIIFGHYDEQEKLVPDSIACASFEKLQEVGILNRWYRFRPGVHDILLACYPDFAAVYPEFPNTFADIPYSHPVDYEATRNFLASLKNEQAADCTDGASSAPTP